MCTQENLQEYLDDEDLELFWGSHFDSWLC